MYLKDEEGYASSSFFFFPMELMVKIWTSYLFAAALLFLTSCSAANRPDLMSVKEKIEAARNNKSITTFGEEALRKAEQAYLQAYHFTREGEDDRAFKELDSARNFLAEAEKVSSDATSRGLDEEDWHQLKWLQQERARRLGNS